MKSSEIPEPIIAPAYNDGFICPKCGTQAPSLSPVMISHEMAGLRLECIVCGYHIGYTIGNTNGNN